MPSLTLCPWRSHDPGPLSSECCLPLCKIPAELGAAACPLVACKPTVKTCCEEPPLPLGALGHPAAIHSSDQPLPSSHAGSWAHRENRIDQGQFVRCSPLGELRSSGSSTQRSPRHRESGRVAQQPPAIHSLATRPVHVSPRSSTRAASRPSSWMHLQMVRESPCRAHACALSPSCSPCEDACTAQSKQACAACGKANAEKKCSRFKAVKYCCAACELADAWVIVASPRLPACLQAAVSTFPS
jgi:hypothetical protein